MIYAFRIWVEPKLCRLYFGTAANRPIFATIHDGVIYSIVAHRTQASK